MNDELVQRIRQCPSLPTLPSIAIQVLELAQRAEVDLTEIARVISKDPALSGKILRTVNSPFYGRSQEVSTISHALVILGLQSVKTLVLGFSLVTNLMKGSKAAKGFKHLTYWRRSIYAATAARSIAAKIALVQQEEVFLIALLQDIGMLVLDQVLGDQYGEIYAAAKTHLDLCKVERDALLMDHAQVGGMIAEQWKLPPLLAVPIGHHHTPEDVTDTTLRRLADVVCAASRCADIFVDDEPAGAINDVRKLMKSRHKISETDCDLLLADIAKRTKEAAGLFEIHLGSGMEFDAILKKANDALIALTLQSQQQATRLQQQNRQLQHEAMTDALTKLANRARFDHFIADAFAQAQQKNQPFALLMLDIDHFKKINDAHGHPAGDAVLRYVGRLLRSAARPQDLAARYGGEEMALCLPNTTRGVAAQIAETIRAALASRPVKHDQLDVPVTTSIGVAAYEPPSPITSLTQLIKAADMALYNAKHGGRNCVKVFALKPPTPAAA